MKLWEKLNEEKEDEEEDDDDDGWKMLTKKKKIKKRKRKKMGMVRLVFSGIASVMMICQWVGCWGLLDWWLGQVTYHDRLLGPEQWQQQQQQQQPQQWLVGAADAHLWLNILISKSFFFFSFYSFFLIFLLLLLLLFSLFFFSSFSFPFSFSFLPSLSLFLIISIITRLHLVHLFPLQQQRVL